MADFNAKNNFRLKISIKFPVFNRVFDGIYSFYKTKADNCAKFAHTAGLGIFADVNVVPCYVRVSQGNHPGQHRIQR